MMKPDDENSPPATAAAVAPASEAPSPTERPAEVLQRVEAAVASYRDATSVAEKATAITISAENALEAVRRRLAERDAEQLSSANAPPPSEPWDADPEYHQAHTALRQSRSVERAARERVKEKGVALLAANEEFLKARAMAAVTAVAEWRAKYCPVIAEAAAAGKTLEQQFETDIDELDDLPEAPASSSIAASPWTCCSVALEKFIRDIKLSQSVAGRYRAVQQFEYGEYDFGIGSIIEDNHLPPLVLQRLVARGLIVSIERTNGEARVTVHPPSPRDGVRFPAEPVMTPEATEDLISGLQRRAATPGGAGPWDRPADRRANQEG